jgi:hypothetical protein
MVQDRGQQFKIRQVKGRRSFVSFVQLVKKLVTHHFSFILPPPLQPPTTSKPFTMPPRTTAPSQIKTRAKNKDCHPGVPDRAQPRRTSVEVENERAAKAQKKAAEQEKKKQNIRRAAEFEDADMANEGVIDATPRPCFTPKPRPPARNRENASLGPVTEVSDSSDGRNSLSFQPLDSEESVTGKESADESDSRPLAKRLKAHTTGKAIPKVGRASPAKKNRKAAPRAKKVAPALDEAAPDEETPRKPKKAKPKVREEIDMYMKEIEEKRICDMAKPTSSQPAGEERIATPPLTTPEVEASGFQWGGVLKRQGAIADLRAYAHTTNQSQQSEDQSTSTRRVQPDDNNPIRQVTPNIFFSYTPCTRHC